MRLYDGWSCCLYNFFRVAIFLLSLHPPEDKKRMCVNREHGAFVEVKFLNNRELKISYNGLDFSAAISSVWPSFPSPSLRKKKYNLLSVRTTQKKSQVPKWSSVSSSTVLFTLWKRNLIIHRGINSRAIFGAKVIHITLRDNTGPCVRRVAATSAGWTVLWPGRGGTSGCVAAHFFLQSPSANRWSKISCSYYMKHRNVIWGLFA